MNLTSAFRELKSEIFGRYDFTVRAGASSNGLYPISVKGVVEREVYGFENGIPIIRCPVGGAGYNPVTVAFYALASFEAGLARSADPITRSCFLRQADWLVRESRDGAWRYAKPAPRYGAKAGWLSAMAQGLGASVLVRAYLLTHDPSYRETALQAIALMTRPIHQGGCSSVDHIGLPFLEEVAVEPASHILNGSVFALWGLFDIETLTGEYSLFAESVLRRLARDIARFDLGYWSAYDLAYHAPARRGYHLLHISQLDALALRTQHAEFAIFAERWRSCLRRPCHHCRALSAKILSLTRRRPSLPSAVASAGRNF